MDGCETADFLKTAAKQRSKQQQEDDKPFHKMLSLDPSWGLKSSIYVKISSLGS